MNYGWRFMTLYRKAVVFEIAPKYYILDSFVNYKGYSISSMRFLPTVVDIMVYIIYESESKVKVAQFV